MSIVVTVEDWFDLLARSELIDADTLAAWRDRVWDQHIIADLMADRAPTTIGLLYGYCFADPDRMRGTAAGIGCTCSLLA